MSLKPHFSTIALIALASAAGCAQHPPGPVVPALPEPRSATATRPDGGKIVQTPTKYPIVTVTIDTTSKTPLLIGVSTQHNVFVRLDPRTDAVLGTFMTPIEGSTTVANPYGLTSFSIGGKPYVLFTPQIGGPSIGRIEFSHGKVNSTQSCVLPSQPTGGIGAYPKSYYYPDVPSHLVTLANGGVYVVDIFNNKPCKIARVAQDSLPNAFPSSAVYNPANHDIYVGEGTGHILEFGQNHKLVKDFSLPDAGSSTIRFPTATMYSLAFHGIVFLNPQDSTIGGITAKDKLIHVSVPNMGLGTTPYSMTLGPDGSIWAAGGGSEFYHVVALSHELKYGAAYRVAESTSSVAPQVTGIVTIPVSPTEYKVFVTDSANSFGYTINYRYKP